MPSKFELAGYLVNLHTLLDAQSKGAGAIPSTVLGEEYERNWALLKETITKENEHEPTNDRNKGNLNESRADPARNQSGRRERDREYGGPKPNPTR